MAMSNDAISVLLGVASVIVGPFAGIPAVWYGAAGFVQGKAEGGSIGEGRCRTSLFGTLLGFLTSVGYMGILGMFLGQNAFWLAVVLALALIAMAIVLKVHPLRMLGVTVYLALAFFSLTAFIGHGMKNRDLDEIKALLATANPAASSTIPEVDMGISNMARVKTLLDDNGLSDGPLQKQWSLKSIGYSERKRALQAEEKQRNAEKDWPVQSPRWPKTISQIERLIKDKEWQLASGQLANLSNELTTYVGTTYPADPAWKKAKTRADELTVNVQPEVKRIAEAEAFLSAVRGEKPTPSAWDGSYIAVKLYLKDTLKDPDSYQHISSTLPILDGAFWVCLLYTSDAADE